MAAEKAFRIAMHSALAAFDPPDITLEHFGRIRGPFTTRAERDYARALCTIIASEARIDPKHLSIESLFCVCSIAVQRHKARQAPPPAYYSV